MFPYSRAPPLPNDATKKLDDTLNPRLLPRIIDLPAFHLAVRAPQAVSGTARPKDKFATGNDHE